MKSTSRRRDTTLLFVALALPLLVSPVAARAAGDITVHATKQDRRIVLDVEASVQAPVEVVWSVLTDYDHMSQFLSAVKSSAVTRREGDHLEVAQALETSVAFMKFGAKSVRAIDLKPMREIHSTHLGGDFEAFEGSTRLQERAGAVVIVNHSEYTPKAWLPPLIGPSVIESETRKQYTQLIAEITRRAAARPAAAPASAASAAR